MNHTLAKNHTGTALLLLDLMPVTTPTFGGDEKLLDRLAGVAAEARAHGVDVIHVRVAFRDGYPELSERNKVFAMATRHHDFTESNPETAVHERLNVDERDIIVTKRRVGSFTGNDLDITLRSRGITKLVLAGVSTSGAVLSTLRQAADLDYEIVVLADGCDDEDQLVHEMLIYRVFPAHAEISDCQSWCSSLPTLAPH